MDLDYTPILDEAGRPLGILATVVDITERVMAGRHLAESEDRFRFLDHLARRPWTPATPPRCWRPPRSSSASTWACRTAPYADMDADGDGFTIRGNWHVPDVPSILGHYSLADFGELAVRELNAGRPLVVNDNAVELAPHEARTFQDIGIAATICMPLVKEGRLTAPHGHPPCRAAPLVRRRAGAVARRDGTLLGLHRARRRRGQPAR